LIGAEFSTRFEKVIDWLEAQAPGRRCTLARKKEKTVPTFAFIDPYGIAGFPMGQLRRFLALPVTEAFINLMWVKTALNMTNPAVQEAATFTKMFGSEDWKPLLMLEGEERRRAFLDLYIERLRATDGANAKFVRSFEMYGKDGALVYWMVFCTNHERGLEKMKDAMWQVDPSGTFRYRDTTARNQTVMFEPRPAYHKLREMLLEHFAGRRGVAIDEIDRHVLLDTPFRKSHLRRNTLSPMEREEVIVVHRPDGKKRGTFTTGTLIDFP